MTLPAGLLAAILAVESGGDWHAVGDGGAARGGLQIHAATWNEAVGFLLDGIDPLDPEWTWATGAHDEDTALIVAEAYLTHWGEHYERTTLREATPEVLARVWNGGPQGWKKPSTLKYWRKIQKAMGT